MARSSQYLRPLQGPLLPPKDLVEEEDDDYLRDDVEEDEDSVFVDAEELCSGGVKAGSLPGCIRVLIPDENTQEKCKVFGRFPITGAWWRVTVQVKPVVGSRSYHYQVQGFPSYFLQSDMSPPNQEHICALFLKECNVPSDYINQFLTWVNEVSNYRNLNFENLRETLRTFQKETIRKDQKQPAQNGQEELFPDNEMSLPMENTVPFKNVMTALQFPKIMEFLPVLLPRHFKWLISSGSKQVLKEIEEVLGTHPWKLGFSKITYREWNLLRCEASWIAFCQCQPLLQLMADLEKNALIIYSKLKQMCREHGHTYVEVNDLTLELSDHMSFPDASESLKFLKDIGVVTYEKACVFPYNLYQAERAIAFSICDLMKSPPWHLCVDVKKVLASIHTAEPENSRRDDALNESKPDEARLENPVDTEDIDDHIWTNGESEINAEISEVQLDQDQIEVQLDQDQLAALEMICSNPVTVISGKGGCGKTTIVSHLFKHIEQLEEREVKKACEDFEQDQSSSEEWITFTEQSQLEASKDIQVLLTAPTGKAAGLLRQKTGLHAYTLCQVNYSFYLWNKKMMTTDKPWKFSSVRVLVVDEGSLVSVGIFKSVLNLLCEHSKLSKLIILGDIRQLPSIEPGNLLKDLFETLQSRNCAIELKTNHRAESQLIVDNATRISRRQFPKFDAELNISDNPTLPTSIQDKTFIFVRLPEEDSSSQLSKTNHHSYLYSAVKTLLQEHDLQNAQTSQFIAFRRQDCDLINDCCCKHYTGHLIKDHQNRLVFRVGDKICCTRNAYLSELLPENISGSQQNNDLHASGEDFSGTLHDFAKNKHDFESNVRLCNGEMFFITNDVTDVTFGKRRFLTINNMAGLEVTVDFRKLMKHCRIKHAWARTIHTFQGSEEQTVVYVVGKAGRQHWQHVYTAVTRGRCRVYVIAEESQLRNAIMKKSFPRKTRLKHFLQNKLSSSGTPPPDFQPPQKSSGDSGGPSTPSASLLPVVTDHAVTNDVTWSEASLPDERTPADFQSPRKSSGDSGEPSTPSSSLLPVVTDHTVTNDVTWSEASSLDERTLTFAERWQFSSPDGEDTDDDLSKSRASERTCGLNDDESPNKIRMVGESPQVSSRLQNLRLNNLIPRQLFKPTDHQET
ncbi:DNA helicase B [Cebus imitator]|uniref:DNA helicase B n=1 Tax=Cebus imitator TaxID=2715852 RepID=UPI00080A04F3|nr:DNA helicase B [Cebus imitator]